MNRTIMLGVIASVIVTTGLLGSVYAGVEIPGYLSLKGTKTISVDQETLTLLLRTQERIPADDADGIGFGYAWLATGPDRLVTLVAHKPLVDHPNIDENTGLHTHILSLKGAETQECLDIGAPLEVDLAKATDPANADAFFIDLNWNRILGLAAVKKVPVGDIFLAEAGIETVVAFEASVIPPDATDPLGLLGEPTGPELQAICISPTDLKGVNPLE